MGRPYSGHEYPDDEAPINTAATDKTIPRHSPLRENLDGTLISLCPGPCRTGSGIDLALREIPDVTRPSWVILAGWRPRHAQSLTHGAGHPPHGHRRGEVALVVNQGASTWASSRVVICFGSACATTPFTMKIV